MTKEEVLQLEKELSFQEFNNHDAYQLGQIIVDHIEKNQLKNVRIRIVLDGDIVFQYLMDGKKGVIWLDRKQKTVEKYGHSSYYIYLENNKLDLANKCYEKISKKNIKLKLRNFVLKHDKLYKLYKTIRGLE